MGAQLELLLLLELRLVVCYLHWKKLHHGNVKSLSIIKKKKKKIGLIIFLHL